MRVRVALPSDLSRLLPHMIDFNREEGIAWSPESGARALLCLLQSPDLGFVGIAEQDDVSVGYFVVCFSFDLEWCGRDAFLTELFVDANHRGRGLGRALLQEAAALAKAQNVAALHLAVRPENSRAQKVYRAAGFADSGRVLYSKPLS